MSVSLMNLTMDKYVKPFSFYDFDTEMYSISFFASDNDGNWDWYVDNLKFNNDVEAQYEIETQYEIVTTKESSCVIL